MSINRAELITPTKTYSSEKRQDFGEEIPGKWHRFGNHTMSWTFEPPQ